MHPESESDTECDVTDERAAPPQDLRAEYEADGFAVVRGAIADVESLKTAAAQAANTASLARETGAGGGPRTVLWPSRANATFAAFRHHPALKAAAVAALGTDELRQVDERIRFALHSDQQAADFGDVAGEYVTGGAYVHLAVPLETVTGAENEGALAVKDTGGEVVRPALRAGDLLVIAPVTPRAFEPNATTIARRWIVTTFIDAAAVGEGHEVDVPWVWRGDEAVGLA